MFFVPFPEASMELFKSKFLTSCILGSDDLIPCLPYLFLFDVPFTIYSVFIFGYRENERLELLQETSVNQSPLF